MTIKHHIPAVLSCLLLLFGSSGCVHPAQRSLACARVDKFALEPHGVTIKKMEIVDARSPDEQLPLTPDTRYFVPALIWYQWAAEGHIRPEAKLYSSNVPVEMEQLLRRALRETRFLGQQGQGPQLNLKVELTHLYGVTHSSSLFIATYAAAAMAQKSFAPYGFASAKIVLTREDGTVLGVREVSGCFSPNRQDLVQSAVNPNGGNPYAQIDGLTAAAVSAAGNLAGNIAKALDPMLADYTAKSSLPVEARASFVLARSTADGLHLEHAVINFADGQILADAVARRDVEPFSAVDEWVVDPYQGGARVLPDEEYAALVKRLQQKYDVQYVSDVRTAHFFGFRK